MSDQSLMDIDYIKSELHDLETDLVPDAEDLAKELKEDTDRILGYFDAYNRGENVILTPDQANDVIQTLAKFNQNTWRYSSGYKFQIRVYKRLMKDRRWTIASKLKFLKK